MLVAAGRRIDAPDATAARFPPQNVSAVSQAIAEVLKRERPVAVVSSAACGADLLVLRACEEMSVPRYVLLPSSPEEFRNSSVTDRPGDWGELYTQVLQTSSVEVLKLPSGQEGYAETNRRLLEKAQSLAAEHETTVKALVIWNGQSRGPDDLTAHFVEEAVRRGFPVEEVPTL